MLSFKRLVTKSNNQIYPLLISKIQIFWNPYRLKKLGLAEVDAQEELQIIGKRLEEEFAVEAKRLMEQNERVIIQNSSVDAEINEIRRNFAQHKDEVVDMLLQQILEVNIEVPKVVQQKFEWAYKWGALNAPRLGPLYRSFTL